MLKKILCLTTVVLIAACSNMTEYERQVADWEPVYCYKSLAAVQCYKEPKHSDSRRLVNFYGPAPREYDAPDPPAVSETRPPKMISTWVKDPEPVPEAYVREKAPATAAPVAVSRATVAATETAAVDEDVSFMDGLRRALFGKPQLANKPVASTAGPTAPAPAAQPVPRVETGTL